MATDTAAKAPESNNLDSVCSMTVLPAKGRYCLGRSACMRLPTPAAGTTAQHLIAWFMLFQHLKESFVFFDHAQFVTGAFFYGFQTAAQVQHFGVKRVVAVLFFLYFLVQLIEPLPIFADLRDAGVAEP